MYNNKYFKLALTIAVTGILFSFTALTLNIDKIPSVYHNILTSEKGNYFVEEDGTKNFENNKKAEWRLEDYENIEFDDKNGILIQFKKDIKGTLIFGLFPDEKMEHPHAVFFKRHIEIKDNKALLNIRENLSGKYDLANWETKKYGALTYRVLDNKNNIITSKRIVFSVTDEKFHIETGITAGPFITALSQTRFIITFWTNKNTEAKYTINGKTYTSKESKKHVFKIGGLEEGTDYKYLIDLGVDKLESHIKTAPSIGNNHKFSFAFASDSRGGTQLGESQANGHNAYIMRKMAALANYKKVDFFQFTGDMINGYKSDKEQMRFEYTNWLRTMSPYFRSIPLNVGMGNHEAFLKTYGDEKRYLAVDNFPFETESAEALFGEFFENNDNGPSSEDGSKYDPNKDKSDFPSYKKNVYSYVYGNTAMIVLNSNYWYTPSQSLISQIGGNAHGYIMDKQLEWLKKQISNYENNKNIEHVFVSIHTPAFPNGGHSHNDMWYNGDNQVRPYIAGKAVDKGIIERRDEFLDILVNQSTKFRVLLTGDEHNYTRLTIDENSNIYPENWSGKKLKISRPFVQIVNGAAGAPYYAKENLPWTSDLDKFSAQFALVIFQIEGKHINIEVYNPDTLELIEKLILI